MNTKGHTAKVIENLNREIVFQCPWCTVQNTKYELLLLSIRRRWVNLICNQYYSRHRGGER
jgi:hypothetical protein